MTMKINEKFKFFSEFFFTSFEVLWYSYNLWKKLSPSGPLIEIPMAIEIISEYSCTVISNKSPIYIDKWDKNPEYGLSI